MPGNAFNYWTCCNHSFPMYWVHVPLHLGFKGAYFIYRSQDFKYRSCISCLQEQSAQIKRPMHPTNYWRTVVQVIHSNILHKNKQQPLGVGIFHCLCWSQPPNICCTEWTLVQRQIGLPHGGGPKIEASATVAKGLRGNKEFPSFTN